MKKIILAALAVLTATFTEAQQTTLKLLVGTYTGTGSRGIYSYSFNPATGKMSQLGVTGGIDNPSFLAISPDKKRVYAVAETGDDNPGQVYAFSIDKNSKLTLLNKQSTKGDAPCHVSVHPSGKWVTVANYTGGNFSVFAVKADGSLSEAVQTIQHTGSGPDKSRQEKPHVHQTVFSPDGKFLFVNDLGLDKTFIYPFYSTAAKPVNESSATTEQSKPGAGPRHITFHPNGKLAFLVAEMSSAVTSFYYADGKLTPVQTVPLLPKDFKGKTGAADIHVSPDGKFVYASNRLETNDISVFKVDASGKMTFVQRIKTGGKDPRNFFISPNSKFLLAGNQNSDFIAVFKRNTTTGLLYPTTQKVAVPKPVCIIRAN